MMSEFPTAPAFGHTQAAAARDKVTLRTPRQFSVLSAIKAFNAEDAEKISRRSQRRPIPRVRAETLAPPALRKERIGKEAPAGMFPPASLFPE